VSTQPYGNGLAERLALIQRRCLTAGGSGLAVCVLLALISASLRQHFFRAYLWACVDWLGIPLGCLVVLMIQHLTGGRWGFALRRLLEAATRTLPVIAALFIPLALGLHDLYVWADEGKRHSDPALAHKAEYYLRPDLVLMRAPVYFAIWIGIAFLLNRWSKQAETNSDPEFQRRLRLLSAPGIGIYGLTITFAAIDWVMSLEPHWYSTIYGPVFAMGQVNAGFSFVLMAAMLLRSDQQLATALSPSVQRDCGNLLLAFVMVWTYLAFSQFLLIWSGNLPQEITWYIARSQGVWLWVAVCLAVLHFAVPFAMLLSRDFKLDARRLAGVSCLVLCMEAVHVLWLIMPAFEASADEATGIGSGIMAVLLCIAAQVGVGGTWLGTFLWQLGKQSLVPSRTPEAEEAASHD
jgi:hypothetical protein